MCREFDGSNNKAENLRKMLISLEVLFPSNSTLIKIYFVVIQVDLTIMETQVMPTKEWLYRGKDALKQQKSHSNVFLGIFKEVSEVWHFGNLKSLVIKICLSTKSSILLPHKYLLSDYSLVGTGNIAVNKTLQMFVFMKLTL